MASITARQLRALLRYRAAGGPIDSRMLGWIDQQLTAHAAALIAGERIEWPDVQRIGPFGAMLLAFTFRNASPGNIGHAEEA